MHFPLCDTLLVHYSEIGTKGKNRELFEKKLIHNLRLALKNRESVKRIHRGYGRIICELDQSTIAAEQEGITQALEKLPGIAYFAFAVKTELNIQDIKKKALSMLSVNSFSTFRVDCRRSNKAFELTSQDLNKLLGDAISKTLKKGVSLKTPDIILHAEICEKDAFLYLQKHQGIGGLPVGTSGKVVCSLSGGIDSPVASFLMMKRGCKVVFVHVFNKTISNSPVISKIRELVKHLTKVQLNSRLYIVPFERIQKEIIANVPAKLRMIVYRRFMMRIADRIAALQSAKGIVTGDSIGQVASQTLDNLKTIYNAAKLPVFAPLIGMNKAEIVELSKRIGTYDYSILPYPDCCSFMIAKHPETKADLKAVESIEEKINNREKLIKECVSKAKVERFGNKNG